MPWWVTGLGYALVAGGVLLLCELVMRGARRRIDQQLSFDEKQWAEVMAVLDVEPHEYRGADS